MKSLVDRIARKINIAEEKANEFEDITIKFSKLTHREKNEYNPT